MKDPAREGHLKRMRKAYRKARRVAEREGADPQQRNRLWWESLPMTYESWGAEEREPTTIADFRTIEEKFLANNPWLAEQFDFGALEGKAVLEVGCGSGAASCLIAREGAAVTAIDLTNQAVDMTARNASLQGLNVRVSRMDAERLALRDDTFDHVFSWGVVHHSHDTESAISEIGRVLRSGGRGMIMVYNRSSLRYWLKGIWWLVVRRKALEGYDLDSVQRFTTDGYFQRHFSPRELRSVIRGAGLTPRRLSVTHMAKKYLPGVPGALDDRLKRRWGWLLVVEFEKG